VSNGLPLEDRNRRLIRLFNARSACLAALRITDSIAPGIVQLPTGAWCDPMDLEEEAPLCVHGNPNVLTRDVGTSSFAQGCTGADHDGAGEAVQRESAADPGV
jgi:anaerobic selenocysteine-containing dehydrogenase